MREFNTSNKKKQIQIQYMYMKANMDKQCDIDKHMLHALGIQVEHVVWTNAEAGTLLIIIIIIIIIMIIV